MTMIKTMIIYDNDYGNDYDSDYGNDYDNVYDNVYGNDYDNDFMTIDNDYGPLWHCVSLRVAAVCPARICLHVAILDLPVVSGDGPWEWNEL